MHWCKYVPVHHGIWRYSSVHHGVLQYMHVYASICPSGSLPYLEMDEYRWIWKDITLISFGNLDIFLDSSKKDIHWRYPRDTQTYPWNIQAIYPWEISIDSYPFNIQLYPWNIQMEYTLQISLKYPQELSSTYPFLSKWNIHKDILLISSWISN